MDKRTCIREISLSEYLDGELPEDALKNVERHLASCLKCHAAFERMKAQNSFLMENLPESNPPAHMKHRLFLRINAEPESRSGRGLVGWIGMKRDAPLTSRAWIYACVSLVFLAVAISAFQFQRYREDSRILAEIDRSREQWAARDYSINPFNIDIKGAPLQITAENPFKPFLNEH